MIDAYPLQWPKGFPRTATPDRSRFGRYDRLERKQSLTLYVARMEVYDEVRRLSGKRELERNDCIISTNMKLRQDGEVYANTKEPEDTGVAVYFAYQGEQHVLACDRWESVRENLHAIAKTIDAIRGMERWGVSDMMQRIFTGFVGITEDAGKDWRGILGVGPQATREEIRRAYRERIRNAHPDGGGTDELAAAVNRAYKQALEAVS